MPKKERITAKEIEADIRYTLRNPPDITESEYNRQTLPAILIAIFLCALELIFPMQLLWLLCGCIVAICAAAITALLKLRIRQKKFSLDNYCISTERMDTKEAESFFVKGSKYSSGKTVYNYVLHFANGKSWRIPNNNYTWSGELPMSEHTVYHSANHGDAFVVVAERKTGKIVVAYHTDFFEYRGDRNTTNIT